MENSHRIEPDSQLFSDGKAYALATGEGLTRRSAAARIALQLENAMVREAWETGEPIASERALAESFGTSRETVRAAIRILEQRGSMRMVRGRFGGLAAASPGPEPAAGSMALYLRACGCSAAQIVDALRQIDPFLARAAALARRSPGREGDSPRRALATLAGSRALALYAGLADLLVEPLPPALALKVVEAARNGEADRAAALAGELPLIVKAQWGTGDAADESAVRSMRIAARLLDRIVSPAMTGGFRIGSEWDLGCEFETCRSTIRQALGMLEDLDLIEPRRGRGGGYVVKRPSPGGVIRHAHIFLTLRPPDATPPMALLDAINLAHLRLAAARLAPLRPAERRRRLRDFLRFIEEGDPEMRLLKVLEELGRLADNPLLDTLARCLVAAQARTSVTDARLPEPVRRLVLEHHRQVAAALAAADLPLAEAHFRAVQEALWALCAGAGRPPGERMEPRPA